MNKIVYRMNRILSLHGAQIYLQHENIILTREKNYEHVRERKGIYGPKRFVSL